jgi:arylsulfatase A-like enzyme
MATINKVIKLKNNFMHKFFLTVLVLFFFCSCTTDDAHSIPEIEDDLTLLLEEDEKLINAKPNILLIIADDMGVDVTPGYDNGHLKPSMPTLESMINSGITFNNVWSNPTCTPTRATLLTGKYGFRTNVTKVDDVLSASETSIQSYLNSSGASEYASAVIGKWHLSKNISHPNTMGIDYYAGVLGGGVQSYWNWPLVENGIAATSNEYSTTKFTDLAIDWVSNQSKPWFLWLAYNAPHTPFHVPPSSLHAQGNLPEDDASIDANPLPYYLAMIEAMDNEMGRLINSMSQEKKDNTIIIFIGDNGTPGQVTQGAPKTRAKGSIYQGGVNVPMVISGKNVTRSNTSENALINTTDLFATIVNIAEISLAQINDSKSFYELLSDSSSEKRTYTYAENRQDSGDSDVTIRNTTHKYLLFDDGSEKFYELNTGELEDTDLLLSSLSSENEAIKTKLINKMAELKQ